MHRAPEAFLHQVVGGRWRLLELLGATEHGAAFRVETLEDGRPARMELWDQRHVEGRGELARFEREARSLSRLRHERCLSVVAFGAHEGRPFLVSDLPAGVALRDELGKPELTVRRALSLGLQLCEGLVHLYGHGVVHRALLPENVWIAESASSDLLKIGLPRSGHASDRSDAPRERFYLPPEPSAARLDHRADVYAAGMLLYVMCTGREPSAEVIASVAAGEPVPPPRAVSPERGISEALERVILRAVAPSPYVRFGTADELMTALQSAGAHPISPKRRPAQRPRRWTAMIATGFAAVAVLGAGALRSSGRQGPSASPAVQAAEAAPLPSAAAKRDVVPPASPAVVAPPPAAPVVAVLPPASPVVAAPIAVAAPAPEPAAVVPAPAAPVEATAVPSDAAHSAIWSLLDAGRLDEGATRIKALVGADPDAAWPRFALGVLDYRKYWRRDSVRQWRLAVARDPDIRRDPQFGAYLCFMLDDSWKEAGVTDLLKQLGAHAVPLLDQCVASAKTPRLRAQASRARDRIRSR
ncbi:MAG: serine/threonine-protein kinase [Pseudomonadota bacterium]